MRLLPVSLLALLLPAALTGAEPNACEWELNRAHHVWLKAGWLLLYGDAELGAYLQGLAGRAGQGAVIPVYSEEPFVLQQEGDVLVSTGFFLRANGEDELRAAIEEAAARRERRRGAKRRAAAIREACRRDRASLPLGELQARVGADIRRYRQATTPSLRTRAGRGSLAAREVPDVLEVTEVLAPAGIVSSRQTR